MQFIDYLFQSLYRRVCLRVGLDDDDDAAADDDDIDDDDNNDGRRVHIYLAFCIDLCACLQHTMFSYPNVPLYLYGCCVLNAIFGVVVCVHTSALVLFSVSKK